MSLIRVEVDPGGLLDRQFTAIEQQNLPFAVMQATNKTAFEVRESWRREAGRVFDRPTPLTQSAALYTKATKQRRGNKRRHLHLQRARLLPHHDLARAHVGAQRDGQRQLRFEIEDQAHGWVTPRTRLIVAVAVLILSPLGSTNCTSNCAAPVGQPCVLLLRSRIMPAPLVTARSAIKLPDGVRSCAVTVAPLTSTGWPAASVAA